MNHMHGTYASQQPDAITGAGSTYHVLKLAILKLLLVVLALIRLRFCIVGGVDDDQQI